MNEETKKRLAECRKRDDEWASFHPSNCNNPGKCPERDRRFLLTLLDQAQRDTERVDLLTMLDVEVRLPSVHGSFQMFLACPEMQEGDADIPSDLRKKLDAAIKKHPKRLDQAALARGEGEK